MSTEKSILSCFKNIFKNSFKPISPGYCELFTYLCTLCVVLPISCRATQSSGGVFLCNPLRPATCKFGGSCSSISTIPRLINGKYDPSLYICTCEDAGCGLRGFDPVCGDDGISYLNDVCRRTAECVKQGPIERVCKGICGDPECEPVIDRPLRCPPNESGRCSNFGECLLTPYTREPYCRCLSGFFGPRCGLKIVATRSVKDNNGHEDSANTAEAFNYKVTFLCVLALLCLVLILLTSYCLMRCRDGIHKKSRIGDNCKEVEQEGQKVVLGNALSLQKDSKTVEVFLPRA